MPESARAWRLSVVLHELQFPAEKWMIQTAAELYGADVQTRSELQNLPEVTYHDIDEVVTAVQNRVRSFAATPSSPTTQCCGWRA
jgi:Protein of unknown function (DUF2795)